MMIFIELITLLKGVRLHFFGWLVKKAPLLKVGAFFHLLFNQNHFMKSIRASINSSDSALLGSL